MLVVEMASLRVVFLSCDTVVHLAVWARDPDSRKTGKGI
jgi:hypothetical protein